MQWPTEAPPPSREEKHEAAKDGYVWTNGRWDWQHGKYAWLDGHWERAQAGKTWRVPKWEQRDGHYIVVEGGWDDGAPSAMLPPPPPGPGPDRRDHRHDWKLERPTVSSYWPTKGKVGSRIIIRGVNFPADTMVMWGAMELKGARVTPTEIELRVPDAAASGEIMLHTGKGRGLSVGMFEVAASYDPIAEQKRIDDERRKAAEAAWTAQQAKYSKDHAARRIEVEKRASEMESSREARREQRLAELKAKWDQAFLGDPDTQAELTLHARRMAELTRMRDVVDVTGDGKLGIRVDIASQRETARHDARMQALHDSFGKGGSK